jgi:capsular exopolysaccharide synthesis family protein
MKKELIAQRSPKSPIAETFRTLRTNIQFMNSQKDLKTILVTSTMPGEGKSWISSNLAITFAQAGKKVVIIDADMRKGGLGTMFSMPSTPGLSNYLSGIDERGKEIDILKYVKATEIENLYLIPAGNIPPNPSELLASEKTIEMLEKLKNVFDIIVLDGTPALLVTDALILARIVDTTMIATAYKSTKKDDLAKVKKSIENVGGKIAGVIINKIPVKPEEYKSTYYYGTSTAVEPAPKRKYHRDEYVFKTDEVMKEEKKREITDQLNEFLNKK